MAGHERNPDELGALWAKTSAKGEYMTGMINGQPVVYFRARSDNPKAPTWRVLKAKPREESPARSAPPPDDDSIGF